MDYPQNITSEQYSRNPIIVKNLNKTSYIEKIRVLQHSKLFKACL